jgi:hypothetical protein
MSDDEATIPLTPTIPTAAAAATHPNTVSSFRAVAPLAATANNLGPLQDLPGFWEGTGFGLIARPDHDSAAPNGFFLELNLLRETLEFTGIGSPVMNRGSLQEDIAIYGVTYLHRVTDAITGGALHIEPGVWLNIPATTAPQADAGVARLATIPHGNAVCTVGFVQDVTLDGIPEIPPANTVPFKIGEQPPPAGTKNPFPEYDLSQPNAWRTNPVPAAITQAIIDDPNQAVRDALVGQTLTHIYRLITSSPTDGIGNIPFITSNANTLNFDSVWAIEKVKAPDGSDILQLQYSQTALLDFGGMRYPHVTVGTLVKAF